MCTRVYRNATRQPSEAWPRSQVHKNAENNVDKLSMILFSETQVTVQVLKALQSKCNYKTIVQHITS